MKCIYCFEEFNSIEGLMAHQENCFYQQNPLTEPVNVAEVQEENPPTEPVNSAEVQEQIKKPSAKSRKKSRKKS
jgi:hypothetical protein